MSDPSGASFSSEWLSEGGGHPCGVSTYTTIVGEVRADGPAALALAMSASWLWLDPREIDPDEITHTRSPQSEHWELSGTFRNLCRHLQVDLLEASRAGELTCFLVSDCQDGGHSREVFAIEKGEAAVGSVECFNASVEMRRARVESFSLNMGSLAGPDAMRFVVGEGEVLETLDPGDLPDTLVCGCGGWDEESDEPICRTLE